MREMPGLARVAGSRHDVNMRSRKWVFACFAAAMLFSMIREWNAPVGCQRVPVFRRTNTIAR